MQQHGKSAKDRCCQKSDQVRNVFVGASLKRYLSVTVQRCWPALADFASLKSLTHECRQHQNQRIFDEPRKQDGRQRALKIPPSTPPADIQR